MSIITYDDVEILCKQLSLLNYIIIGGDRRFTACKDGGVKRVICDVHYDYLILYEHTYLDYCAKNSNNVIENFIKNKKIKLQLYPNIYKSNIKNFDLISILCIFCCKYFTNIVNSKKIEKLFVDSLKNNKNIKGINLLKKLNIIGEIFSTKLNININIMNQVNKLNKYNIITNNDTCIINY